jgi:hypothetical protein
VFNLNPPILAAMIGGSRFRNLLGSSQAFFREHPHTAPMTRLRPLVIPAAALALATAAPSAVAQQRRPVDTSNPWAASPQPTYLVAAHADGFLHATAVQPTSSLPYVVLETTGEAANPDGRFAVSQPPADVAVAGRPTLQTARGPP